MGLRIAFLLYIVKVARKRIIDMRYDCLFLNEDL